MQEINIKLLFFLNDFIGISELLDGVFLVFVVGAWQIVAILFLIVFLYIDKRSTNWILDASFVVFSSMFAWFLAKIIKLAIKYPRPFLVYEDIEPLIIHGDYDSFPSGHATFFMAFAVAVYFFHKKLGLSFVFLAILIGVARVIAGVHYPVDIVVGFMLGAMVAYFMHFLLNLKVIQNSVIVKELRLK